MHGFSSIAGMKSMDAATKLPFNQAPRNTHRATGTMSIRPERYRNAIVPHIYVDGATDGIAFYKRAFGAEELLRISRPDGKILHAEISICGSVVMIGDPDEKLYAEPRALGRASVGLHIFVDDNEALLKRAVAAGAEEIQKPTEMFYGANSASLRDPFGHIWVLLVWKEDLQPAEMERRAVASGMSPRAGLPSQ
jgi:PhnB protein